MSIEIYSYEVPYEMEQRSMAYIQLRIASDTVRMTVFDRPRGIYAAKLRCRGLKNDLFVVVEVLEFQTFSTTFLEINSVCPRNYWN